MATIINADTSNGLKLTSDTSGIIELQSGATAIARVNSDGILNGQADGVGNIGNSTVGFNTVHAIATSAQYADLAEKYSTAQNLPNGTVVTVGQSEDYDVEACSVGTIAIGVVSTDPALMMNSKADGQYIGLKGRLPVRVVGAITKGQSVYAHNNGCASAEINGLLVGIALETNLNEEEKLVECVLKV